MCLLGDMSWKEWPFPVGAGHVPVPPRLFWGRYCGGDAALALQESREPARERALAASLKRLCKRCRTLPASRSVRILPTRKFSPCLALFAPSSACPKAAPAWIPYRCKRVWGQTGLTGG